MRNGLIVVAVCLLAGAAFALVSVERYKQSVANIEDLFTALVYFIEDHRRMPESAAEFVSSPFIARTDAGFRVVARPESRFRPKVRGREIRNLASFDIRWKTDLAGLEWQVVEGLTQAADGSEVLILGPVTSIPARRSFTHELHLIYSSLTNPATSGPASSAP